MIPKATRTLADRHVQVVLRPCHEPSLHTPAGGDVVVISDHFHATLLGSWIPLFMKFAPPSSYRPPGDIFSRRMRIRKNFVAAVTLDGCMDRHMIIVLVDSVGRQIIY